MTVRSATVKSPPCLTELPGCQGMKQQSFQSVCFIDLRVVIFF